MKQQPRRLRLSVRTLILLVALVPAAVLIVVASVAAVEAWNTRQAAVQLQTDADTLAAMTSSRAIVADEEIPSSALAVASEVGVDSEVLLELYEVDFEERVQDARRTLDADPNIAGAERLADELAAVEEVRQRIDDRTATFAEVNDSYAALGAALDQVWFEYFAELEHNAIALATPGSIHERVDALEKSYLALLAGGDRMRHAVELIVTESPEGAVQGLLESSSRLATLSDVVAGDLGPEASAAWEELVQSPEAENLEEVLDAIAGAGIAAAPDPVEPDLAEYGGTLVNGAEWASQLNNIIRAAAVDLQALAAQESTNSGRALAIEILTALGATILALGLALAIGRQLANPLRRLGQAANQVREGNFDIPPLPTEGPRELADTAHAFNQMSATLSAVEAHAVALAEDPDAPIHEEKLPGATGRALQEALGRLRSSIRAAEQRRLQLQEMATRDPLTGLANRRAAFEMMERDIARAERDDQQMLALFLDLDGLKPINDSYGHDSGDEALRSVAEVLRSHTRASDVVARLGGDEFLVAGPTERDDTAAVAMAERIRQAIEATQITRNDQVLSLSVSIGATLAEPAGATADSIVREADLALYEAKRQGRNRIAWAG